MPTNQYTRKSIQHIVMDMTGAYTELCHLGRQAGTDKSPYNTCIGKHKHPYTAIYDMILSPLRHKSIHFAEIGIAYGDSAAMWFNYFSNPAKLYFFDYKDEPIQCMKNMNLSPEPYLGLMDVSIDGDITRGLKTAIGDELFDIILDDSSHVFEDQIRIIREAWPFIKPGGMLIVEDINRSWAENDFEKAIRDILRECSLAYFVVCNHEERFSPGYNNDKILVLVKSG